MEWKDNYLYILENNCLFIQGDKDKEIILSFDTEVWGDYLFNSLKGYGCQFKLNLEPDFMHNRINKRWANHYFVSSKYYENPVEEYLMIIKWYKLYEFYPVGLYQKKKVKFLEEIAKQAVKEYDIFCPYKNLKMGPKLNISRQFIKSIIFMKKLPRQTNKKSTNGWFCSWNTFESIQNDEEDEEPIYYKDVVDYYNEFICDPSIAKFEVEIGQSFKNTFNINYFVNNHIYNRVYLEDGIIVVLAEHRKFKRFLHEVLDINEIFYLTQKSNPDFYYMLDD